MSDDVFFKFYPPEMWHMEPAVRWSKSGVLEQLWQGDKGHVEWRPVPTEGAGDYPFSV